MSGHNYFSVSYSLEKIAATLSWKRSKIIPFKNITLNSIIHCKIILLNNCLKLGIYMLLFGILIFMSIIYHLRLYLVLLNWIVSNLCLKRGKSLWLKILNYLMILGLLLNYWICLKCWWLSQQWRLLLDLLLMLIELYCWLLKRHLGHYVLATINLCL